MIDLSNGAQWQKIYDRFHVAQPIADRPGRHYPIFPVVIPVTLDNYTVAVSCKPTASKPTWQLGAKVYSLIDISNPDIDSAKYNYYYTVKINEINIIKIKRLSTYYRLLVEIPNWFADAYLQVWVYTGTETIKSTDERLAAIEQDLERIEAKLDSYSTP